MRVLSVDVGLPREVVRRVRSLDLDGDRQADLRARGGQDKAVYAYPSEYYELW